MKKVANTPGKMHDGAKRKQITTNEKRAAITAGVCSRASRR